MDKGKVYDKKQVYAEGFNDEKAKIFAKYLKKESRILDIGCADGKLGEYFKKELGAEVYGVEISKKMAKEAENRLDKVFCADIEKDSLKIKENFFDYIVFADVLEHLQFPEEALKKCRKFLKEEGRIVVSLPNIASAAMRLDLLLGRFSYTEQGILDNTHLRFYTKKTGKEFIERSGFKVLNTEGLRNALYFRNIQKGFDVLRILPLYKKVDEFLAQNWQSLFAQQVVFVAEKSKKRIGWCSVFPPTPAGGANISLEFARQLNKSKNLEVFAVPCNNIFPENQGIKKAKISEEFDAIVFFLAEDFFIKNFEKIKGKKIVYQTIHGPMMEYGGLKEKLDVVRKADLIAAPTMFAEDEFKKNEIENVHYVPLFVDTKQFVPKKGNRDEVVYSGRLCYYKGANVFLESAKQLLERDNSLKFRVIGNIDRNFEGWKELEKKAGELKARYPERFFFFGEWKNTEDVIPKVYENALVLVMPSNNEGFGLPLIEAMSCGIPVIASDKQPMNEIVLNERTGFCLPVVEEKRFLGWKLPKPEDICEKILYLKENPSVWNRMSEEARNRAVEEYSLQKNVKKFEDLILKVVE